MEQTNIQITRAGSFLYIYSTKMMQLFTSTYSKTDNNKENW